MRVAKFDVELFDGRAARGQHMNIAGEGTQCGHEFGDHFHECRIVEIGVSLIELDADQRQLGFREEILLWIRENPDSMPGNQISFPLKAVEFLLDGGGPQTEFGGEGPQGGQLHFFPLALIDDVHDEMPDFLQFRHHLFRRSFHGGSCFL